MASVFLPTWEHTLLPLVDEAEHRDGRPPPFPVRDLALLARAYACCAAITSMHSRTFSTATSLLPGEKPPS